MQVYIYSSDSQVVDGLIMRYPEINWVQLGHAKEIRACKDEGQLVILLRSPVKVGSILVSPERVWKKYLAELVPYSKFIVSGFAVIQHSNYLDLLSLPEDFVGFVDQALPVEQDWLPISTGAMDMNEKLRSFFSGHGKESVLDIIRRIRRPMQLVREGMEFRNEGYNKSIKKFLKPDEIHVHWQVLENRWNLYYFLFNCLPFFDLFEKTHILIQSLDADFRLDQIPKWDEIKFERVFEDILIIEQLLRKANHYV